MKLERELEIASYDPFKTIKNISNVSNLLIKIVRMLIYIYIYIYIY